MADLAKLYPLLNVEEVATHTEPGQVNRSLQRGWVLLSVYPAPDGSGGQYAVYVVGKRRTATSNVNPDPEGYDQRNE